MINVKKLLPNFLKNIIRKTIKTYYKQFGIPLRGILTGFRMKGEVLEQYISCSYEIDLADTIIRIVKPGWTCIDAGAHMGYFTLFMARLIGENGKIYSFEPHPKNFHYLSQNVELNRLSAMVNVYDLAVADISDQLIKLCKGRNYIGQDVSNSSEWNIIGDKSSISNNSSSTDNFYLVKSVKLDDIFNEKTNIDFVKIDVEGAAKLVLKGMISILDNSRPVLFIEFHNEEEWGGKNILFNSNYVLYDVKNKLVLNKKSEKERCFHCLAIPSEKINDMNL